jgi:hypothetical protein
VTKTMLHFATGTILLPFSRKIAHNLHRIVMMQYVLRSALLSMKTSFTMR